MNIDLHPRTKLVHGGIERSEHHEMSETLYLTQGFAYPDAGTAEARFDGSDSGYAYARYGNPTVGMFEQRLALMAICWRRKPSAISRSVPCAACH